MLSILLNKLPWSDLLLLILNSLFSSCSSSLILFFCQHQLNCSDSVCTMLNIMVAKLQDTLVSTCSCWRTLEKAQPQKINIEFFYLRILCLWLYLCCLLILYILLLLHADTTSCVSWNYYYSSGVPTSYSHSKSALFAVPKYSQGNFRVESLHWRLILMCEAKQMIMVFHRDNVCPAEKRTKRSSILLLRVFLRDRC